MLFVSHIRRNGNMGHEMAPVEIDKFPVIRFAITGYQSTNSGTN